MSEYSFCLFFLSSSEFSLVWMINCFEVPTIPLKKVQWWNCEDDDLPFWEESDYAEEDHELNSHWPSEKFKQFFKPNITFLIHVDLISIPFHLYLTWFRLIFTQRMIPKQQDLEEKPERELAHDSRLLEVGDSQDLHDFAIETADVANKCWRWFVHVGLEHGPKIEIHRTDQHCCNIVAMLNIWFMIWNDWNDADMLMLDSVSGRHRRQRGAIRRPASPCGNGAFRRPRLQRDLELHLHRALLLSRCLPTVTDVTGRSADHERHLSRLGSLMRFDAFLMLWRGLPKVAWSRWAKPRTCRHRPPLKHFLPGV